MIEFFVKQAPPKFKMEHLEMFSEGWFKPEEASTRREDIQPLVEEELKRYTTASKRKRQRKQKTASAGVPAKQLESSVEANDQSPASRNASNDHSPVEKSLAGISKNSPSRQLTFQKDAEADVTLDPSTEDAKTNKSSDDTN